HKLVYFEETDDINEALAREKSMKKWERAWKIELIEKKNPNWQDLYQDIVKPLDPRFRGDDMWERVGIAKG
ncbi:MAG: hypothetical protein ABID09_02315, partial [Candidatus Omnitrophota bacterium]